MYSDHAQRAWFFSTINKKDTTDDYLRKVAISNVWGVGRRWAEQLNYNGIRTAFDLANTDHRWIRNRYSVVLQRTAMELAGVSCIEMENAADRKQILVSRSFRPKVTDYHLLRQFIAGYVSRAAEKLRSQNSLTKSMTVFIRTKSDTRGNSVGSHYANTRTINLSQYTADTATLIRAANWAIKQMYQQHLSPAYTTRWDDLLVVG